MAKSLKKLTSIITLIMVILTILGFTLLLFPPSCDRVNTDPEELRGDYNLRVDATVSADENEREIHIKNINIDLKEFPIFSVANEKFNKRVTFIKEEFRIPLPDKIEIRDLYSLAELSPPIEQLGGAEIRTIVFDELIVYDYEEEPIGFLSLEAYVDGVEYYTWYLYSNLNKNIVGEVINIDEHDNFKHIDTYDLAFKSGWNIVYGIFHTTDDVEKITLTTTKPENIDFRWEVYKLK